LKWLIQMLIFQFVKSDCQQLGDLIVGLKLVLLGQLYLVWGVCFVQTIAKHLQQYHLNWQKYYQIE